MEDVNELPPNRTTDKKQNVLERLETFEGMGNMSR